MTYKPDSYPRNIPAFKITGRGEVTVSAKGIITGDSDIPNDGADFGPDTMLGATAPGQYGSPYTKTSGLQEIFNYSSLNSVKAVSTGGRFIITQHITLPNNLIFDGLDKNITIFDGNSSTLANNSLLVDTSSSSIASSNITLKNLMIDISSGTGANYYFVISTCTQNLTIENMYCFGSNTSSGGPPFVIGFSTASSLTSQNIKINSLKIDTNGQSGGNEGINIGANNYSDVYINDLDVINTTSAITMTMPSLLSAKNVVLEHINLHDGTINPTPNNSSLPVTVNIIIKNSYGIRVEITPGVSYMNVIFQNCLDSGIAYNPSTALYSVVFDNCWWNTNTGNNNSIINLIVNGGGFYSNIGVSTSNITGFSNNSTITPQFLIFKNVFFGPILSGAISVKLFNLNVATSTYLEISNCILSDIDTSPYNSSNNSGVDVIINGTHYGQNGIKTLSQIAIAAPCITVFKNNHTINGNELTAPEFGITTPALPTGTGSANAITNSFSFPIIVYQTGESGTHIVDANGNDVALPADPPELRLNRGDKIYYATTVATSWKWYGV